MVKVHRTTFVAFLLGVLLLVPGLAFADTGATDALTIGASDTKAAPAISSTKASSSKTFKVVFKANGGKGTMKAQSIKRGKKTALKANSFKRSGYKFVGWNTKKNGKGKTYKNKAQVKNLTKAGKKVTLYAQWKKVSRYVISTPYYKVTVPKEWRGKVDWVTKASTVNQYKGNSFIESNKTGKKFKIYHTYFYLKGHKNDAKYWLATIGGERKDCNGAITGFGEGKTSIIDARKGERFIYMLAANMPYQIAQYQAAVGANAAAKPLIPDPASQQEALLKLVSGDLIKYETAKKLNIYDGTLSDSYKYVQKYLQPIFKKALKVL